MATERVIQIRKELHPLKSGSHLYRAYEFDGTPLYIAKESKVELRVAIHRHFNGWNPPQKIKFVY